MTKAARHSLPFSLAVKNVTRAPLRSAAAALATACVACLLTATATFVESLDRGFRKPAQDDVGVLISVAAEGDVVRSSLPSSMDTFVAADVDGVLRVAGVPAVSPEIHVGLGVEVDGVPAQAYLRGMTDRAFLVHDAALLVEGRAPGSGEALVGRLAAARLGLPDTALAAGSTVSVEGMRFCVVGTFAAPGTALEGEIWLPLADLRTALKRDDVSVVFVRMDSAAAFSSLELFARRRLDLEAVAMRAAAFFDQLARTYAPVGWMARLLAALVAVAALVSGVNVLQAAVARRSAELAVLRTMGYSRGAILASLVQEVSIVGAAGAAAGLFGAQLLMSGHSIRVSMTAIALEPSATTLVSALGVTLVLCICIVIPASFGSLTVPLAAQLRGDT